ncbi:MAG: DUF434 domain-containing protein [Deltaproteobacteria bacterium]|nr:DUF434 domain-containing protein [Deltaproteobacteria bacterium]
MSRKQRHRGPHPGDEQLFSPDQLALMRTALNDYCWLLERDYAPAAALKLVGDRYSLRKRQRDAVLRCACTEDQRRSRQERRVDEPGGQRIAVDGFNALIIAESMLSGGPIIVGRDGARRDIASVHGSYKRVEETSDAVTMLVELLAPAAEVKWYFDQPVSNSGRAAQRIRDEASSRGLSWTAEVVYSPDRQLVEMSDWVIASSDAWILDNSLAWIDLASLLNPAPLWLIDLRSC